MATPTAKAVSKARVAELTGREVVHFRAARPLYNHLLHDAREVMSRGVLS